MLLKMVRRIKSVSHIKCLVGCIYNLERLDEWTHSEVVCSCAYLGRDMSFKTPWLRSFLHYLYRKM